MGKKGRIAAAEAKRQRRMAKAFKKDLDRTILFYAWPERGFVASEDPDGAYLSIEKGGQRQVIVAGKLKAPIETYVKAVGVFLKTPAALISESSLDHTNGRPFRSLIIEVV